jgi:hypothetical protein
MLRGASRAIRWRVALALAALYALCILLPPVAFAFGGVSAHCLTDAGAAHVHMMSRAATMHVHGDGSAHSHANAAAHDHADGLAPHDHADGDGKSAGTCCGLFCIAGIAHVAPELAASPVQGTRTVAVLFEVLTGRDPDRINRPPIG